MEQERSIPGLRSVQQVPDHGRVLDTACLPLQGV